MKPVTDPNLLSQLEQKGAVTDPALLALLEGGEPEKQSLTRQKTPKEVAKSLFSNPGKNIGMGAIKGASDIGATFLSPLDATGLTGMTSNERRASMNDFFSENADPESLAFKGGEIGTQIAGTAGVGSVFAKGATAIPALTKFAPVLKSGGFNLGQAATGNRLVNALMRVGGGAIQGGTQAAMINPDDADTGAVIGGAAPGVVGVAGKVGSSIGRGIDKGAHKLMQSALKPTIDQLRTGKANVAVQTLLDEGINPTKGGVEKLRARIGGLNDEISGLVENSDASVSKQKILDALGNTRRDFSTQVSPTSDLAAIQGVADDFSAHPLIKDDSIPVKLAQAMKQGTYKVLNKKYGQIGSAETEAQKALARGLKENISDAVPEIAGLNARESKLITTLGVAERRALMEANKNPMGLALLANNPATWAAFMADKSALFKSLAARLVNTTGKVAGAVEPPLALQNFVQQKGLLGAPSVLATSP